MNKFVIASVLVCLAVGVQAASEKKAKKAPVKAVTKEQYVANQTKILQKKGKVASKEKLEAAFVKLDKNADGTLNTEELAAMKKAAAKKTK